MIVTSDCFTGFYNIAQNCYDIKDLEAFIEQFEPEYLCEILGPALSEELMNEWELTGGVLPPTSKFYQLFKPICLGCNQSQCGCSSKSSDIGYSIGLKTILTGLIYYDYVLHQQFQHTITGKVVSENETSNTVSNISLVRLVENRYNKSILSIQALQLYISNNSQIFTNFTGYCTFKLKHYPYF